MLIVTPCRHPSPRLARTLGPGARSRKRTVADLLITPLVDMFVIIVIFLLQNFSASGELLVFKDIELPEAVNGREMVRTPMVQLSDSALMVEGEQIALVADLERDEYWNIPALEERLRDLKKRYEVIHQQDPAGGFKGEINIQAHKEVQFKILKRVMFACSQAGYLNVSFAVLGRTSAD
jgi:biopolymer transport protein ExbD